MYRRIFFGIVGIFIIFSGIYIASAQKSQPATADNKASEKRGPVTHRSKLDVNLNNGNFSTSYIDFAFYADPLDLAITRTYNSRSNYEGFFGLGWSSNIDTYLEFLPDGSILLHEGGGGQTSIYVSATQKDLSATVDELITKLKTQDTGKTETYWKKIKDQALTDEFYRRAMFRQYYGSDAKFVSGAQWRLKSGLEGQITKTQEGHFKVTQTDAPERTFDAKGNLLQFRDSVSNAALLFKWQGDKLQSITDPKGRNIQFVYSAEGILTRAVFTGDTQQKTTVAYKYEKRGKNQFLSAVKDGYENLVTYQYAAQGNLTKIVYHDKTEDVIEYEKNKNWVSRVKSWNGSAVVYNFEVDSANPLKQSVSIDTIDRAGKKVGETQKYGYLFNKRKDGSVFLVSLRESVGKQVAETTYNECCNLPVKVVGNNVTSTMDYDAMGRMTRKIDPSGTTVFAYEGNNTRPTSVTRNGVTYTYKYGKSGVERASGPAGEVDIAYNTSGRINTLKNAKKGTVLKFDYNRFGQPNQIVQDNFGKIDFKYNEVGALVDLVPTPFKEDVSPIMVATKITGTFQDFLTLMLPTRVTAVPESPFNLSAIERKITTSTL